MSNLAETPRQMTMERLEAFVASQQLLDKIDVPALLAKVQLADPDQSEDPKYRVALIQERPLTTKTGETDTSCKAVLRTKTTVTRENGLSWEDCNIMEVFSWQEVSVVADSQGNTLSFQGAQVTELTPMEYLNPDILKQTLRSALDSPKSGGYRRIPTEAYD